MPNAPENAIVHFFVNRTLLVLEKKRELMRNFAHVGKFWFDLLNDVNNCIL